MVTFLGGCWFVELHCFCRSRWQKDETKKVSRAVILLGIIQMKNGQCIVEQYKKKIKKKAKTVCRHPSLFREKCEHTVTFLDSTRQWTWSRALQCTHTPAIGEEFALFQVTVCWRFRENCVSTEVWYQLMFFRFLWLFAFASSDWVSARY